jgi:uncharacterized protein YndB with AHSA1/START domain
MIQTMRFTLVLLAGLLSAPSVSRSEGSREVYETEIAASVADVWNAFTTKEGLQSWMAPLADIDLAVGGKMRSNYNAKGELGDETTIENTILSFDPERMLSLKATRFPAGAPFAQAAAETWSVFYFDEVAPKRTRITIVGLGYTESEASQRLRSFFAAANRASIDKLRKALAERLP